jgi:CheY-like chemotaxis protein
MTPKVLIVDDNETNLLVAERMVAAVGCATLCALNGQDAIALYRRERPDLIFMDLSMPDMDGFETASEIMRLQDADRVKAPIIAMTAHPSRTHKERCLNAGFSDFLEKPATFDKVEEILGLFVKRESDALCGNKSTKVARGTP